MKKAIILATVGVIGLGASLYAAHNNSKVDPDGISLTEYVTSMCQTHGGEYHISRTRGHTCEVEQMNGRFKSDSQWYQFFYQLRNAETGLVSVEMHELSWEPDADITVLRKGLREPAASGEFIHKGGNLFE